jgi:asparagine synthase (glutamine-hydrolysing)
MCGIVGYLSPNKTINNLNQLYTATALIAHRGPDDEGYAAFNLETLENRIFCGPDSPNIIQSSIPTIKQSYLFSHQMAFGFRRFSIVDLSDRGHQPFWSQDKSICLIYNGEIYNYVEIRQELEQLGYSFVTSCDTEVLMIGYQAWGMDVLNHCNGPIALALYDSKKKQLFLARDRIGKSPLYYAIYNGNLYWASEIKSILSLAGHASFDINEQTVFDYLNYGWRDLDNTTFWKGIQTLPAASWTVIDLNSTLNDESVSIGLSRYWNFPQERKTHKDIPFSEAVSNFKSLFLDSLRIRARADANVAYSLSGGLDSSSIVAAAANISTEQFRTYSIKFPGDKQDEEPLARLVYEKYSDKIDYHTYTPENQDFWEVANDYIWLQEEPFHYPNSELFQAYFRKAREDNYKVMIIGSGGDELLAGYKNYFFPLLIALKQNNRLVPALSNLFLSRLPYPHSALKKRLIATGNLFRNTDNLLSNTPACLFNQNGFPWADAYLKDESLKKRCMNRLGEVPYKFHEMTVGYMSNWLMNYWLRNSNKSHFGVPMETRSPLLDYRLIDYVFTLPPEYLVNFGWTKYILRKSVQHWLPKQVIWNRKKQGLPFNTKSWFLHAKPIVEKHLNSIYDNPYVDTNALLRQYDNLLQKQPTALWRAINFCLWWKRVILKMPL